MSKHPIPPSAFAGAMRRTPWEGPLPPLWDLLDCVPEDVPLLFWGGSGSDWNILALSWDECSLEELAKLRVGELSQHSLTDPCLRWSLGYLVLKSYESRTDSAGSPARAFRIHKALVRDEKNQKAWLCEDPLAPQCQYQTPWPLILGRDIRLEEEAQWFLQGTDADYLQNVTRIVSEIAEGRYYQLNLLRYWQSSGPLSRNYWLRRMRSAAGPFSAYIDIPDLGLLSCSPERFVQIERQGQALCIRTEPIKGTRPVRLDRDLDLKEQADLASHPKDRAELSMIVDLMRNDLQRISHPGSVRVLDPGSVHSFSHVHHLIARIESQLRQEITFGELWEALCPGGSITGAPKKEVMIAIAEREQRSRGYLMGNLFFIDAYSGCCDSSILIRTAVRRTDGIWEYAAGSGLTIHSNPQAELEEVRAKARVILG